MLHVMSVRRVARDLHTIAPWPLERRVGDSWRRSEEIVKRPRIAPFNAIIIVLIIIIIIILFNGWCEGLPGSILLMTELI